ncbi:two-component sensor histidine kinase [Betaproteobacteria bacterium]|nr:two-component sensor histidine kinase [Betaproteobacteria bacterium]
MFPPRSLFARIFLWAALLVILSNAAWMLIFHLAEAKPRGKALAQFSTSVVNLVRVSLLTAEPELRPTLLQELSDREGIRLLPRDPEDRVTPLPDNAFIQSFEAHIRQSLGDTTLSFMVNDEPGLWISFAIAADEPDDFWLILPTDHAKQNVPWLWLGWGALAALLVLAGAAFLASTSSRSLRRMADAARQVGRGQIPPPLAEGGSEELQQLVAAFNHMSRDLDYHDKERAEILAGISHDLRTPLSRMRLEAELSLPEGAAQAGMVADIMQMDAIIAQFLDYARGEGEEQITDSDPNALLESLARHAAATQHPVTLVAEKLPRAPMKSQAVWRAIGNLINNAWKYGAPPVTLSGSVESDGRWLALTVTDCGIGIPAHEIERLKRPFTRLGDARSEANGTGLGLAIVERVAKNHGGSLEITADANGKGLRATLRLPLTRQGKTPQN